MRRSLAVGLGMLLVLHVSCAWALSGSEWRALPDAEQLFYVLGVVDAWEETRTVVGTVQKDPLVSDSRRHAAGAILGGYTSILACLDDKNLTNGEIHSLVKKWVEANPEERPYMMSGLVWLALQDTCPKLGVSTKQ